MRNTCFIFATAFAMLCSNCSENKLEEKGFQVDSPYDDKDERSPGGIHKDSLVFETKPSNVLLTGNSNYRLNTIYKVNHNKNGIPFIGSNTYHSTYEESDEVTNDGNNWHSHIIPGFEAVYGYNLVNISHYDISRNLRKNFFEKPVLIKTLYYPSFSVDTLNHKAVNRQYFMLSVYNEDSNKDGFINLKDLRRLYLFNIYGEKQKALLPENYSVIKSEYDPANDFMYVFAQLDVQKNGKMDEGEPVHIFWIDLNDPSRTGQQY